MLEFQTTWVKNILFNKHYFVQLGLNLEKILDLFSIPQQKNNS